MNCCDDYGNCNQGRDCPVRKERMTTKKFPRTMQEAFGPYTSHAIAEPSRPYDWQDRRVMATCIAVVVCLVIASAWGVL